MKNNMAKKYLSTTEVATILGISRVAVFKKISSGVIKAQKVGRNYIIDAEQLGLYYGKLDSQAKKKIKNMVKKIFDEYGDVIKKLGNE